jgi:2-methylcitrate dehydratase PrpD
MNGGSPAASERPSTALAEFAAGLRLEDVPESTLTRAKELLLDAMACAIAAERGEELPQIEAFASFLGGEGTTTVLGEARPLGMAPAVLVNGYRITAVTVCDVYTAAHCHVTPEVVPPVLAVAERTGADGAATLAAFVAGLEVATRVARGLVYREFRSRGWHAPGVVGPFGGAAGVAHLLGLDAERTRHALALAGSQSAGTWAAWGTPTVKFHQARGALSGTLAGLLAAEGFRGSDEILTHPDGGIYPAYAGGGDAAAAVEGLGSRWELDEISLRMWPSGTPLQPVITALFLLLAEGPVDPSRVSRVVVHVPPHVHAAHARFTVPGGTFEALLSIPYVVGVVLHDRDAWLPQFTADRYTDPALRDFIERRVELEASDSVSRDGAAVELWAVDGGHRRAEVGVANGHPLNPLSRREVEEKVHRCADDRIGADAADELIRRVMTIEEEPGIAEALALACPAPVVA